MRTEEEVRAISVTKVEYDRIVKALGAWTLAVTRAGGGQISLPLLERFAQGDLQWNNLRVLNDKGGK